MFPDGQTRQTALPSPLSPLPTVHESSLSYSKTPKVTTPKNSFGDVLAVSLPGRVVMMSGALVTVSGDKSERRFAAAQGHGATIWIFDEISGAFDVPAIKRYTSLSPVRVEHKGRDSEEILPTWFLVALVNELPVFNPSDDQAFLARLIVLPFRSVFCADNAARERYIKAGVSPNRLHPARDKAEILTEIEADRPGIVARLIAEYITLRDEHGGVPVESPERLAAKESYRTTNDYIERFYDETLRRVDGARMTYPRIRALFDDFMGESTIKMSTRKLVDELTRRFRFIERGRSSTERYLENIAEAIRD